jgi:hypothetical protein
MYQTHIGDHEATWRELFWTPDPPTIEGVCEKLGRETRYFSHGCTGLSVAEHSILVAEAVMPGLRLKALLHDAGEAYTGDVPKQVKAMFSGLAEWCEGIQIETILALGLQPPTLKENIAIKMADRLAFVAEVRFLFDPKRAASFIAAEIDAGGPLNLEAAEALTVYGYRPYLAGIFLRRAILAAMRRAED